MSGFGFTAFNYRWAHIAQLIYGVEQNFWDEQVIAFVNVTANRSFAARCQECDDAGRC
jgi:hypothetical protein